MRQDVQPASVRDPDEHLVGTRLGRQLDGLVEHGNEDVQPLDRELLLPDERAPQVGLEPLDLRKAPQQLLALLRVEIGPEPPRLDGLAQPHPLRVVGDVLDLVRDRARVDLAQRRQRLEQGLAGHREPKQARRDARLQLVRQRRLQAGLVERRVAHRLGAERIEARVQVPVHAIRLDERHGGRDPSQELVVGACARRAGACTGSAATTWAGSARRRRAVPVSGRT